MKRDLLSPSLLILGGLLVLPALAFAQTPPATPGAPSTPTTPSTSSTPSAASTKVATVNGVVIPKSRVDVIVKAQTSRGTPDSDQLRNEIRDQLIVREVVTQEATRKGLGKGTDVQAQLDLARQNVLWNAYIADFIKTHPVSDDQIKAEYERLKSSRGDKEYKARHILVEKEDDAKNIIADLKKGKKFEDLAKQSKDPGSKDRGGDLDWNSPSGYVKPFADALVKLDKGKYTDTPVQTQYGWHVILLEDVRPAKFPTMDEIKPQITERLQEQAFKKNVDELRAKAKVE
jgi:peptidyl-prolyl cis-trans isomerase C